MTATNNGLSDAERLTRLGATYCFVSLAQNDLATLAKTTDVVTLTQDAYLFRQDDTDTAFYILLSGRLAAGWQGKDSARIIFDEISPGDTVGEMQIMVGGKNAAGLSAMVASTLLRLPRNAIDQMTPRYPDILQKMGDILTLRLRRGQLAMILPRVFGGYDHTVFREIEALAEWVHLTSDVVLFQHGEPSDCFYLVVSGRLQVINQQQHVIAEISRGECAGEVSILTETPRTNTIRTLRETDLLKFSKAAFEHIINRYPMIMKAISKIIIKRFHHAYHRAIPEMENISIALVPITPGVDLHDFTQQLIDKLSDVDSTLHLHGRCLEQLIDMPGAADITQDDPQSIRVKILLDHVESQYHFTIYQADANLTTWTQWCLKRADKIFLVANASADPKLGTLENSLLRGGKNTTDQELVLLHDNAEKLPTNTRLWLSPRNVRLHHHIRKQRTDDYARLTRFISGRAIGIALSGGGARGFAHFGVYEALLEAGIPIDMVGGTSMGGFIGAQCAAGMTRATMLEVNRRNLVQSNPFKQYILPLISLLSSKKLKANLFNIFGHTHIEDLWLNFFCISSNLSTSKSVIHRYGPLAEAIRASTAIPGIAEPVLSQGEILIDGGILNNLPGDIIREYCGTVILVDVSSQFDWVSYHAVPSPWQYLLSRLPFRKKIIFPSIIDVLISSTLLSSTNKACEVKADADYCLHPPVEKFKLLEFSALDELVDVGYRYTKAEISNWSIKPHADG